jgi:hypothetical protein
LNISEEIEYWERETNQQKHKTKTKTTLHQNKNNSILFNFLTK